MSNKELPSIRHALEDLLHQVETFCAQHGEADFETGRARAALAAQPVAQAQALLKEFDGLTELSTSHIRERWAKDAAALLRKIAGVDARPTFQFISVDGVDYRVFTAPDRTLAQFEVRNGRGVCHHTGDRVGGAGGPEHCVDCGAKVGWSYAAGGCGGANVGAMPIEASNPAQAEAPSIPKELDVRTILLEIVPGDGSGFEVYAKSVSEVVDKLSEMGERLEEWELGIRRFATPPTPCGEVERDRFEAAHPEYDFTRKAGGASDDYRNSYVQGTWEGWQARASIATQPLEQKPVGVIVEQALANLCDALTPAFTYRGVSLRVSQEDHEVIRSALAGANTALHLLRTTAQPEQVAQDKPTMFWDHDDPEVCQDSIFEVIDREWNGGTLKHGDVMEIQRAVRLPNIKVRLIPDGDGEDYFDYEVIEDDRAARASGQEGGT